MMPHSQKIDLSIMSFKNRHFVAQCSKDLHSKYARMKNTRIPKNVTCIKFIVLEMANASQQEVKMASKILLVNHEDL